jgi:hypothetical protein
MAVEEQGCTGDGQQVRKDSDSSHFDKEQC